MKYGYRLVMAAVPPTMRVLTVSAGAAVLPRTSLVKTPARKPEPAGGAVAVMVVAKVPLHKSVDTRREVKRFIMLFSIMTIKCLARYLWTTLSTFETIARTVPGTTGIADT